MFEILFQQTSVGRCTLCNEIYTAFNINLLSGGQFLNVLGIINDYEVRSSIGTQ